ncbi:MAG TPA: site-specific integrase [Bacteroidales bacterium]|nr:site-specific integrase [Bacteroidales bacterium]
MPSYKIVVRKDEINSAGQSRIKIRISHRGQTRYISVVPAQYIEPSLVTTDGQISPKYPGASKLNIRLNSIKLGYQEKEIELGDKIKTMTCQKLKEYLEKQKSDHDFFSYSAGVISNMKLTGHLSTAESYTHTLNHLRNAIGRDHIPFSEFTVDILRQFEIYLQTKKDRPNKINSRAVHLRNLRAIFNRAIDDETIGQGNYPFRRYEILREETTRKDFSNLSLESLRKLIEVRALIPGEGRFVDPLHRAADIFMLSFYLIGINPTDLARLKKTDLVNGRIHYRRAKTGRPINVKVEPEAMEIIKRYQGEESLLNFMENRPVRKEVRSTQSHTDFKRNSNKYLQKLAEKLEIPEKIMMTSARYSWATIAAGLEITDSIIDRALGHKSPYKLVAVYTRYEIEQVDAANRKVIDKILNKSPKTKQHGNKRK